MKKYLQKINYLWLLFYVFVFLFLLHGSFAYLDNDLGWHLKMGQDIYQTGEVPHLNYSNYTIDGVRWVDHEWLSNLLSYIIYVNLGYVCLSIFFVLIFLLTLILLNNFILKYYLTDKKNLFYLLSFEMLGLFGVLPHLGVRMQEFTVLFFVLLWIIIHEYNQTRNYRLLAWLPVLFYFWANLHAGFLVGIVLLFFWVGVKMIEIPMKKVSLFSFVNFDRTLPFRDVLIFFVMSCIATASTFLTPYGVELYSFLNSFSNTFYTKVINEWLPVYYYPFQYWKFAYIALFIGLIFIAILMAVNDNILKRYIKKHLDLWQLSCLLVFLWMSFNVRRHFPLFFVISLPILIQFFSEYFPVKMTWLSEFSKNKLLIGYLLLSLFLSSAFLILNINFTNNPFENPGFCKSYPCDSVKFLKNNPDLRDKKILNDYSWGGYMIWLWPEKKLFIDGRLPQYEYKKRSLLEEYGEFKVKDRLVEKLKEHDIELVHLQKRRYAKLNWFDKYIFTMSEEEFNREGDMEVYLKTAPDWKNVYEDEVSIIYIKK